MSEIPYEDGDVIPPGYKLETRARRGWLISGLTVSLGLYLIGGVVGSAIEAGGDPVSCDENGCHESHSYKALYVPIVGPFITAGTAPDGHDDTWTFLLVADGVLQIAGAFAAVAAVVWPVKVLERKPMIQLTPVALDGGAGLGMQGNF
jgi:hypothetical protein